uniref:Protein tyrosine phosphatase receptor type N2 n=1 Tax=Anabas testudineus TaxID=64144 RepID=A0AAQ6ISR3_ANATE
VWIKNTNANEILDLTCVFLSADGMFGRCHSVPVKEVYTYDVSPSVVQRFRMLLEKLSNRGTHTQTALIDHICAVYILPVAEAMDPIDQRVKPVEVELSRNLQTYLQRLGLLPKTSSSAGLSTTGKLNRDDIKISSFSSKSAAERFIEDVLKNVGRQHVDVDNLTQKDLDQLSRLIADALQVVDRDPGINRSRLRVKPGPRDLEGELEDGEEEEEDDGVGDEEKLLKNAPTLKPQERSPIEPFHLMTLSSLYLLAPSLLFLSALHHSSPFPTRLLLLTIISGLQTDEGLNLMKILARRAKLQMTDFAELSVVGPAVTFKVRPNAQNISTADVANVAVQQKVALEKEAKLSILEAGVADGSQINQIPTKYSQAESTKFLILTVVSILCIVGVLLASTVVYCLRHRSHHKLKEKLTNLGTDTSSDATATYQELCRQRMAVKPPAERPEPISSRINSVSSQFSDGGQAVSPSARSSISSWSEEPAHSNMDISTGHMILSYMEDHLKNKDRLEKEWEALCAYQAEPNACTVGLKDSNAKKNRSTAVVAYDHSRITLKVENSQGNSDYINASPIMDHDPRNPAYIATQGPLPSTVADFWQMVWENGCVVIVMLTPLVESGVKQCYHYWPDEGSNLYHIYEVNLVSEHIWCDDFLVRSFYLKNMQTNETRTVTQFHFLTWLNQNVPETSRMLLDFRRKVNKCYRGRSCPIIVHCSDGAGRTGTYILIDMVLNKMAKGAKEIDIAATLEHLRDQRPGMVQTKDQFEFALTAVAEEVNAILKVLPQ